LASTANTSTANTSDVTTTNAARRRSALGGFVFTSNGRSGIQSANHAAGIIGLIQLAGAHPSRWEGTLGHNQRTQWFNENVDAFFKPTDLLECSIECLHWFCFDIFQRHRIKQEHSLIADTRTTNPVLSMKIFHRGHNSFFGFLNHSKVCLQHLPRLLRLGVKGAVLCLV
jgi:hypothetical protein